MNPDFLREGTAVEDVQNPDKIVFGTNDLNAGVKIDADGFTKPGETLLRDRNS